MDQAIVLFCSLSNLGRFTCNFTLLTSFYALMRSACDGLINWAKQAKCPTVSGKVNVFGVIIAKVTHAAQFEVR